MVVSRSSSDGSSTSDSGSSGSVSGSGSSGGLVVMYGSTHCTLGLSEPADVCRLL